jgi:hypothetical protein
MRTGIEGQSHGPSLGGCEVSTPEATPEDTSWMRTLAQGQDDDRTATHGYEATREAAMVRSPRAGGEKDIRLSNFFGSKVADLVLRL